MHDAVAIVKIYVILNSEAETDLDGVINLYATLHFAWGSLACYKLIRLATRQWSM